MLRTTKVITVGRVGGLAVALGVGGLLAAAPAWADESDRAASTGGASAGTHRSDRSAAARGVRRVTAARIAVAPSAATTALPARARPAGIPQPEAVVGPTPEAMVAPQRKPPRPGVDYRSIDGSGNSVAEAGLNAAGADFSRIGDAQFSDGISALRTDLPNTRTVSNLVVAGNGDTPNAEGLSAMMYSWGQFIDHDITLTASDGVNHIDIAVPDGDSTLSGSIPLTRSVINPLTGVAGAPAIAINNVTGWLDGSMVYGSDVTTSASLRGADGHLLTSPGNNLPIVDGAFVAGDIRAQENPDLTALQTLFVREHNRQVDQLRLVHPDWTGDRLYEQARAIVTAEIAHITYTEYLPHLLGADAIAPYEGYQPGVDPRLTAEFVGAAYRFGHSIVPAELEKIDEQGNLIGTALALRDAFFQAPADFVADSGADGALRHLTSDPANALDVHVVEDLRSFLFGPEAGLDLAAINLQRGRDLGLGTLNQTRVALGLAPFISFASITSDVVTAAALEEAYGDVNKVELWIGGLAEDHVPGAMVGETFQLIIGQQFQNLRDGDRFWYENQGFDPATLRQIESTTLSSVILDNTTTEHMQADAFVFYERSGGLADGGMMGDPASPQLVVGALGGDTLVGGSMGDLLVAGTGRQVMTGGGGADTFIVGNGDTHVVITDFEVGTDRLQVENLGQPANSGFRVKTPRGEDKIIVKFGDLMVSLVGVQASEFKLSDVIFI